MFVYLTKEEIPAVVPTLFAFLNVFMGVLGFRTAYNRIRNGDIASAHRLWIQAYNAMFGILAFGYRRFFFAGYARGAPRMTGRSTVGSGTARAAPSILPSSTGAEWAAGAPYELADFFTSEVFFTLLAMGLVLLPALFYGPLQWAKSPANANLRRFPLPALAVATTARSIVYGTIIYILYLIRLTEEDRA